MIVFLSFPAGVWLAVAGFATLLSADLATQHLSDAAPFLPAEGDTVRIGLVGTSCCCSMSVRLHSPNSADAAPQLMFRE